MMQETIDCQVCGKATKMITAAHLRQHSMTVGQYKERFPDAPMASEAMIAKKSATLKDAAAQQGKTLREKKPPLDLSDAVQCMICGKMSKQITHRHVVNLHGITMEEYRSRYPDAPLFNEATKKSISEQKTGVARSEEVRKAMSERMKGVATRPSYTMPQSTKTKIAQARLNGAGAVSGCLEILDSKGNLEKLLATKSVAQIANDLGVHETTVYYRLRKHGIEIHQRSSLETDIEKFLTDLGVEFMSNTRSIIRPQELDFYVPSANFAIEVCGLYWHSDQFLKDNYHRDKLRACDKAGIRLVTIFEDELIQRFDLIKDRLRYFLKMGERGIGARKHTIKKIDRTDANQFYDRRHIQGGSQTNHINYGSFVDGELVSAMSFRKSWRFSHKGADTPYELTRFATDGRNHGGIASKLFKAFVTDHSPEKVITYADRRWSNGDLYTSMGMAKVQKEIQPSYSYFLSHRARLDKNQFRLEKIRPLLENSEWMTERQIMRELGYGRIYDCGYYRFEWKP